MGEKHELLYMVTKLKLSTTDTVTLTTYVWTDTLNTRSYLGVIAHFVSEDKLESVTALLYLKNDTQQST